MRIQILILGVKGLKEWAYRRPSLIAYWFISAICNGR